MNKLHKIISNKNFPESLIIKIYDDHNIRNLFIENRNKKISLSIYKSIVEKNKDFLLSIYKSNFVEIIGTKTFLFITERENNFNAKIEVYYIDFKNKNTLNIIHVFLPSKEYFESILESLTLKELIKANV